MGKLAINWQNFAQVGLQLEFAFRIRLKVFESIGHFCTLLLLVHHEDIN